LGVAEDVMSAVVTRQWECVLEGRSPKPGTWLGWSPSARREAPHEAVSFLLALVCVRKRLAFRRCSTQGYDEKI